MNLNDLMAFCSESVSKPETLLLRFRNFQLIYGRKKERKKEKKKEIKWSLLLETDPFQIKYSVTVRLTNTTCKVNSVGVWNALKPTVTLVVEG